MKWLSTFLVSGLAWTQQKGASEQLWGALTAEGESKLLHQSKHSSRQGPEQGEGTVRSAWGHSLRALINKNKCSSSPKEMFSTFQSHFVWSWSKQRGKALTSVLLSEMLSVPTASAPTSSYLTWNSSSLINDLWSGPASLLPSAALSIEYSLRAQIPQRAGEENLSGQQLHTAYVAVFMERVNMENRCIWF